MDDTDLLGKIRLQWDEFFNQDANSDFYLNQIKDVMQKQADFDLSLYRDRYLKGRLFHRVRTKNITSFKDYVAILNKEPAEIKALKELLTIHTTDFFRDVTPFQYLERILLPKIASSLSSPDIPIRILSAPCSTGQEVYSFAMIAHTLRTRGIIRNPIEIYGVDIDEKSVEKAQIGLYRTEEIKNMTPEMIKQNFDILDKSNIRVKYEIRNYCHFQKTDLFKPLPFKEKFDLIACRNLLIYISRNEQLQIISILKNNAKIGSYFLFGTTEGFLLMNETEFRVESLEEHYYQYLGEQTSGDRSIPPEIHQERRKPPIYLEKEVKSPIKKITSLPIVEKSPIEPIQKGTRTPKSGGVKSSQIETPSQVYSEIAKISSTLSNPIPNSQKIIAPKHEIVPNISHHDKKDHKVVQDQPKIPVEEIKTSELPKELSSPSRIPSPPALESLSQTMIPKTSSPEVIPAPIPVPTKIIPIIADQIREQIENITVESPKHSAESQDKKVEVRALSETPKKGTITSDKAKLNQTLNFLQIKAREKSDELAKIIQKAKDAQKERDTFRVEIKKASKNIEEVPEIDKWLSFLQEEEKDKTDELLKIIQAAKQTQKERDAVHNEIHLATLTPEEILEREQKQAFIESREKEKAAEFDRIIENAKKAKAKLEKQAISIEKQAAFTENIPLIDEDRELNKWLDFLQTEEKEKNDELVKILQKTKQPEVNPPLKEPSNSSPLIETSKSDDPKNAFIKAKEKEKSDELAQIIEKAKQAIKERKSEIKEKVIISDNSEESPKKDKRLDFIRSKEKEKSDELTKIIEKAKRAQVQIDAFQIEINRIIKDPQESTENTPYLEFIKAKEKEKADEFAKIVQKAKKTHEEMDKYRTEISQTSGHTEESPEKENLVEKGKPKKKRSSKL